MNAQRLADDLVDMAKREKDAYEADAPDERPLGGYAALLGVYATGVTAASLFAKCGARRRRRTGRSETWPSSASPPTRSAES